MGIFEQISKSMGCENANQAITVFRDMMIDLELANPIPKNLEADVDVLSNSVNPVRLKNNPVEIGVIQARQLYSLIV